MPHGLTVTLCRCEDIIHFHLCCTSPKNNGSNIRKILSMKVRRKTATHDSIGTLFVCIFSSVLWEVHQRCSRLRTWDIFKWWSKWEQVNYHVPNRITYSRFGTRRLLHAIYISCMKQTFTRARNQSDHGRCSPSLSLALLNFANMSTSKKLMKLPL